MKTNPHTYSWIKKSGYGGVHAIGAVWASILYDVYWAFVDAHGFDADWYDPRLPIIANSRYAVGDRLASGKPLSGNQIIMQLVVDGMKLQPCRPTFIDARDAIIQADEVNFGGEHVCLLWKSFAKRGLGKTARRGGVDSFEVPHECN
jgi:extracellular elastinolytic metalloproteinase